MSMRKGFTTSTCAAASTLASLYMLIHDVRLDYVVYKVPAGYTILFPLEKVEKKEDCVLSCIRKDGGDDPDVTDNIVICSKVRFIEKGIRILGGEGVGIAKKPGLFQKIGESAINPSAKKMIIDVVTSLPLSRKGVEIEIIVPRGKEVAKDTYNPKIGIENGISILGTTGIVNPMSEEAWIKTILLEERIKKAEGKEFIVLVMGNYGFNYAVEELDIKKDYIVKISGYIGDALKGAYDVGFRNIVLIGQVGKMIKVAGGIFNVHNKIADGRFEILGFYLYRRGIKEDHINKILKMMSIEEASEYIAKLDKEFFSYIAQKVSEKSLFYLGKEGVKMGTLIYSLNRGYLGANREAEFLVKKSLSKLKKEI